MGGTSKGTTATVAPAGEAVVHEEISVLERRHQIGAAVMAGVCAMKGWRPGKQVTEEEFLTAVQEFNQTPIRRRKKKKEAKGC